MDILGRIIIGGVLLSVGTLGLAVLHLVHLIWHKKHETSSKDNT